MKLYEVPTPSYVVDLAQLEENLKILRRVSDETGAKILLAQKAFSMFATYPLIKKYLAGTTASGLYEAKLGYEEMGGQVHVFSPAFKDSEFDEIVEICDHIVFNSFNQLEKFKDRCKGKEIGIRINPECSTQTEHEIYDPCAYGSRLGVTIANFREDLVEGINGLHFHPLCEQNADDLETTLKAVEKKFGKYLYSMKWLNMGGGHHISRKDYDIDKLIYLVNYMKDKYDLEIYLEPGEAVALNAGYLACEVLDIVDNGIKILILDASAACHMPDVLEMPYRPPLKDGYKANEKDYTYRLSSATCLSGDIIGDYSFEKEIHIGDRLYFEDMAIYSMVKNNTFNGIALPSLYVMDKSGECKKIKSFSYEDFKGRLS